jgi:hypothetical protein
MASGETRLLMAFFAVALCLCSREALADRVYWGCMFAPTTLQAGPLTCSQTVTCGSQSLSCKQGDKTLFVADAFADRLAVSERGQYIVGLSNHGVRPLFWLRDFRGGPIDLAPAVDIHFCSMTVTNVREWFDYDRPDVRFEFQHDKLAHVVVRGCDGHDVFFNVNN